MAGQGFQTINVQSVDNYPRDLQLLQSNISSALTPLQSSPLAGGVVLTGLNLVTAQDNVITHNLGHVPTFFIVGNLNANSVVWKSAATTTTITLQCSANVSCSLWIN